MYYLDYYKNVKEVQVHTKFEKQTLIIINKEPKLVDNDELFLTEKEAYFAAGQKYMSEIARLTAEFNAVVKKATSLPDKPPEENSTS